MILVNKNQATVNLYIFVLGVEYEAENKKFINVVIWRIGAQYVYYFE